MPPKPVPILTFQTSNIPTTCRGVTAPDPQTAPDLARRTQTPMISENENGRDGVDVFLDLSRNFLLLEFVFPNIASVRQPGRIEDAVLQSGNGHTYPPHC